MTDLGHDLDEPFEIAPAQAEQASGARRKLLRGRVSPMAVLASAEFLLLMAAFMLSLLVRFHGGTETLAEFQGRGIVFALTLMACMGSMGLYTLRHRAGLAAVIARLLVATAAAGCLLGVLSYAVPALAIGRGVLGISLGLALPLLIASRHAAMRLMDDQMHKPRVLVLGSGQSAAVLASRLRRRSDQRAFRIMGYMPWLRDKTVVSSEQLLRPRLDLATYVMRHRIDQIVVALDDRRGGFPQDILRTLRLQGVTIQDPVTFLEKETGYISVELAHPSWLIFSSGFPNDLLRAGVKRLFDIVAASILLIAAAPIALVAAIAVKLQDGGPILYRQVRAGRNARPFTMYKFRSMGVAAEKDGKAVWAAANDPRVTRVGSFMRKTRIDEIPQVFNVLIGNMSFVGPRPERPEFVESLSNSIPFYRERHFVKPGITGWAQVRYPYGASEKDAREKLGFDLYYVKNHSLLMDLMILLVTAEIILFRVGSR
jgi:sugar transferase (PEP-CTERM system associated)